MSCFYVDCLLAGSEWILKMKSKGLYFAGVAEIQEAVTD